ncbi:MAG: diguanylate cyclase [Actinomycetota bacterium]
MSEALQRADDVLDLAAREAADDRDLSSAFEHAPIGMAIAEPDGVLLRVNPALAALLGTTAARLVGSSLFEVTHPNDLAVALGACDRLADQPGLTISSRVRLLGPGGAPFHAVVSTAKVLDRAGRCLHLVMHVQDVSVEHAAIERLRQDSTKDPLTGLANRVLMMNRLDAAIERHSEDGTPVSVLFLDLDGFKTVNDTHGHGAGDAVLVAVARELLTQVRRADTVARLGGDEFVLVCPDTDAASAAALAARIVAGLARPPEAAEGGAPAAVTASIGTITLDGGSATTATDLLRLADHAMYDAKRGRRAT